MYFAKGARGRCQQRCGTDEGGEYSGRGFTGIGEGRLKDTRGLLTHELADLRNNRMLGFVAAEHQARDSDDHKKNWRD